MSETPDRILAALERIVGQIFARVDYMALYPCNIDSQNGDGTLELTPDNEKIKGLSKVPLRVGIPGCEVKVSPGAKVLLGFEDGNPSKPYAALFTADSLKELNITASAKVSVTCPDFSVNGVQPIARQGDTIIVTPLAPGVPVAGVIISGNPTAKA
jgi:hypothetical protein